MPITTSTRTTVNYDGAALAGRLLLSAIFIISGVGKIAGFEGTAGAVASKGLPIPQVLAVLTIVVEVVGGIMLAVGFRARLAALALAVFTLLAAFFFHDFWAVAEAQRRAQFNSFWKNVAITGGMLMVLAFGPGRYSLDRR